ncbi:MAG: hypothetical protein JW976_15420 [Syntrophaceae bacterium]|nr:hypothetical protein [Syntrophaceae bacterium]
MWRCPKCGSTNLNQYRMPYGPMWCMDCAFRIEDKNITPNPFYAEDEKQDDAEQEKPNRPGLGEQLAVRGKKKT